MPNPHPFDTAYMYMNPHALKRGIDSVSFPSCLEFGLLETLLVLNFVKSEIALSADNQIHEVSTRNLV